MKIQGAWKAYVVLGLAFVSVELLTAAPAMAMAKSILSCTSNNSSCAVKGMPVLNQLSEQGYSPVLPDGSSIPSYWFANGPYSSVLCVPTSGSMLLRAV